MQALSNSPIQAHNSSDTPKLGLICITAGDEVRYRTVTRKRLLSLSTAEQERTLRDLYAENLRRLHKALEFCHRENIFLYRLSSNLFPFSDEAIGRTVLDEFTETMHEIGEKSRRFSIRLTLHPDQFVVLNSDKPEVIENSRKILQTQAGWLDRFDLPRSQFAPMNIHGGKSDRSERLVNVIQTLPDNIRQRLTLENDEYAYSATEIAEICLKTGVAMCFDAHHHVIHEKLESYDDPRVAEMVALARTTWQDPDWQLVHISNGKTAFHDPEHSDLIEKMPGAFRQVPWIDIEAKAKERAIALLEREWLGRSENSPAMDTNDKKKRPTRSRSGKTSKRP
ncbi:UV DNA damage repair endonuclease UvsE [Pannus brasiliensis CCIBt3594]|uniref:UV DNA damage repair endonuclease UvsE n=1 Tax=Pannus brasiliensis CCIBt3594 TaxID=1427578 RepID=A0AAW9QID0_9CHRO